MKAVISLIILSLIYGVAVSQTIDFDEAIPGPPYADARNGSISLGDVDNAFTSPYVPMYAGVTDVAECYKTYDKDEFSDNSIRWAVDFVDNLLYLKWQEAVINLQEARDPLEQRFFEEQESVDDTFMTLYKKNPKKAIEYITDLTIKRQNEALKLYQDLRITLITKYTNNKQGI